MFAYTNLKLVKYYLLSLSFADTSGICYLNMDIGGEGEGG